MGNQAALIQAATDYRAPRRRAGFEDCGAASLETKEERHGRTETRTFPQMPVPKDLPGAVRRPSLQTLGVANLLRR